VEKVVNNKKEGGMPENHRECLKRGLVLDVLQREKGGEIESAGKRGKRIHPLPL